MKQATHIRIRALTWFLGLYLMVALIPPYLLSLAEAFVVWHRPALYFADWPMWLRIATIWWWVVWTSWVGLATVREVKDALKP